MKNNHSHLKRLAAISLVLMMCLSALPMLAPSASAATYVEKDYFGNNMVSDSPLEAQYLAPQDMSLGQHYDVASDGVIYKASETILRASWDHGETWDEMHTFPAAIRGVYVHEQGNNRFVMIGTSGGAVYRAPVGGDFELVLQMNSESYAWTAWSFSSMGKTILVGEYGGAETPAAVHISYDNGQTWSQLFNTSAYSDRGAHIHLVSIDPYDPSTYYINVGDNIAIKGLYVTHNGGSTWQKIMGMSSVHLSNALLANGFLSCTFPDPYRVLFFADNYPAIYEYVKSSGELRMISQLPYEYHSLKLYSAVLGQHGVTYFAGADYGETPNIKSIWITIDGSSYYRIGHNPTDANQYPLRAYGGKIYSANMVFNDLTIEEAMALMGDERRSVDMRFGSPRYMDFTSTPLKEVQISVHGAQVINYITNPSFEFGLDGWVDQSAAPISTKQVASNRSRDGNSSLHLRQESPYIGQIGQTLNFVSDGTPLYLMASMTTTQDNANRMQFVLRYSLGGESFSKYFYFYQEDTGQPAQGPPVSRPGWLDYSWTWAPPAGATLTSMSLLVPKGHDVYIDRVALSNQPMWVPETTGSGNVSFMIGDQLVEAGELAEGESRSISLPSDVWLDGLVPIVPVSGLAYTVSIDGTPVSESDRSILETNKLLEQTIPLIIGLAVIGAVFTMLGRLKF